MATVVANIVSVHGHDSTNDVSSEETIAPF
jgi:hypothetical protein